MKRAWLNLRFTVPERMAIFTAGLERLGFEVKHELTRDPRDGDVLISWNRIHEGDEAARIFTERGNAVLVTENATWGNSFAGRQWYTIARNYHNVRDTFPIDGPDRFDSLGVGLGDWRSDGETVVLASRGIGPAVYRMPAGWVGQQRGRVRAHPGRHAAKAKPLCEDLAKCGRVVTWGSGAAVLALMWGVPVESHQPNWIGEQNNTDAGRLAMLRNLAHAQFTHEEIRSGEAFERLLYWQGER